MWECGKGTDHWVEVRLDKTLVSHDWCCLFPAANFMNLEVTSSDHCPVLFDPRVMSQDHYSRRFRFENSLAKEPMCQMVVQESWEDCVHLPVS